MKKSLVQFVIFWYFLDKKRNPVEIMCPLPIEFYKTDALGVEITRNKFIFAPTKIRTVIMWICWISNLCLIIAAFPMWSNSPKKISRGVRLMKLLPSVQDGFRKTYQYDSIWSIAKNKVTSVKITVETSKRLMKNFMKNILTSITWWNLYM